MADFGETPTSVPDPDDMMKQPIKKLEPAINRYTKIVIPLDLDRLSNHCRNIQKLQQQQQWDKLRAEQINARRTVQQLKANVREMEKVRLQVCEADLEEFDGQMAPVKDDVIHAVVEVIELCGVESSPLDPPLMSQSLLNADEKTRSRFHLNSSNEGKSPLLSGNTSEDISDHVSHNESEHQDGGALQQQAQQTVDEEDSSSQEAQESWVYLKEELVQLNSLTHEFAAQVKSQQGTLDHIQNNIEVANMNVAAGVRNLLQASRLKTAMLPLGGALLGGIVGGPVGLVAGVKVGAAAALGGGAIGFLSGRAIKKRKDQKIQMEMSVLTNGSTTDSLVESRKDK
ncbi:syntaxin-17-like [Diadema setosum]|uniref:syntaxin-17-like n=1 Tax=Diadema setosum TaxID=31175 RepID=UPI003B3A29AA